MSAYASFTVNGYYTLTKGLTIGQALSRGYLSFTGDGLGVGGQECTQFYSGYLNTDIPADALKNDAECPDRSDPKTHCIQFHERWKYPTWDSFTIPEIIDGHEVKYCFLTVHPLYANTPVWNEINAQNCGPTYRDVLGYVLCIRYRDEDDNLHFSPVLNSIYNFNFIYRQNLISLNPDVIVYDPEYGWGPQRITNNPYKVCDLCLGGFCAYDIVTEEYFGTPYTNVVININGMRFYEDYRQGDDWLMSLTPETTDFFSIDNSMSRVLLMGRSTLNSLFSELLFNNDATVKQAIAEGLSLYGQNPSDLVIDLCQLPFNPFDANLVTVDGSVEYKYMQIGAADKQIGSFNKVTALQSKYLGSIDLTTSANTQFPIKNDWHDYLSYGLYLYLPYAGIYALNAEKYLHTNIKLKVMFDIRTGSLKYYVFADEKCEDMFEGMCRISCPISGSDKRAAADMYKSGVASMISGGAKIAVGLVTATVAPGAGAVIGGAGGAIAGGAEMYNAHKQLNAPIPMTVSGGFSGSSNIFDDKTPKLIEVYQPYIDDGIVTNLGKPDNKYQSFASISGYVEAKDVKLVSSQTVVRQEMLKQCLAEGCIL